MALIRPGRTQVICTVSRAPTHREGTSFTSRRLKCHRRQLIGWGAGSRQVGPAGWRTGRGVGRQLGTRYRSGQLDGVVALWRRNRRKGLVQCQHRRHRRRWSLGHCRFWPFLAPRHQDLVAGHTEDPLRRPSILQVLYLALAIPTSKTPRTECLVPGEDRKIFDLIAASGTAVGTAVADERSISQQ